jgi:transcriptional regulator with XRE-family HTH domain
MQRNWSQPRLAAAMVRVADECNRRVPEAATLANMISKWERGDRAPDQLYRHLLALALKVSVEDLGLDVDPDFRLHLPRRDAGAYG